MGQIQRLTRGRVKPYNSIPRIDWSHPLAAGLVTYCYDAGGVIIDLVNGGHISMGANGTAPFGSQSSVFGRGLQFPTNGWGFMPPLRSSLINSLGGAAPYSAADATFLTGNIGLGTPDSSVVSVQDSANTENTVFGFNCDISGGPQLASVVLGNANVQNFNQLFVTGTYQSWGFTATGASAGTLYANGAFDSTTTLATTFNGVTQPQIMYSTASINSGQTFGNGLNGFVPYFAMWGGRALKAADYLLLARDPYCFLIYPEDEMLATLVGVIAGGTAVTSDSGVPFEFLSSLRSDGLALLEWITSVRADRPLQLEALAAIRRDNAALSEFVAGLSANTAAQLEFLGSTRRDNLGPLEMASALRSDVVVLLETLSGQRSDMIAATEIVAGLRADLIMPIENLGTIGVTGSAAVQIETTSAFKSDAALPFEIVSSFRSDATAQLEFTTGSSAQSGVTLENTLGLQGNSAVQTETQGGVGVTGSAVVQLEITAKFQSDAGVLFENFLAVSFSLSGMTINSAGVFIPFVTVLLFRTSDNAFIASTTSDAGGNYSFTGLPNNTTDYFVNGYLTGAPDLFGTTSDKLTPS